MVDLFSQTRRGPAALAPPSLTGPGEMQAVSVVFRFVATFLIVTMSPSAVLVPGHPSCATEDGVILVTD
ncbi:hypothetical protein ACOMHN_013345 [Nucella lapillus]